MGRSSCAHFVSAFLSETIAMLPGGWDLAHAIRLGIKPFAELGANSEALSGSQVDSPCSCRAIFESAPVAMLQSQIIALLTQPMGRVDLGGCPPRSPTGPDLRGIMPPLSQSLDPFDPRGAGRWDPGGSETGTRLVPRLGWPALRTNGVLQPQLARRPLNPLAFAERSAPLDAHPHAPEFLPSRSAAHSRDRPNPRGVSPAKAVRWP